MSLPPVAPPVAGASPGTSRIPIDSALITGRLIEHGAARHEFRPRAEDSYFLRVRTAKGDQTFWSPGLERALARSNTRPQIGDEIGVRRIEITPVARAGIAPGSVAQPQTYWIVERSAFFAERIAAARALRDASIDPRGAIRDHPELLGAYFALDSARKVAEARIANPESRERFVALVREALAHAAERGEPLPAPKSPGAHRVRTSSRSEPRQRDDPTR